MQKPGAFFICSEKTSLGFARRSEAGYICFEKTSLVDNHLATLSADLESRKLSGIGVHLILDPPKMENFFVTSHNILPPDDRVQVVDAAYFPSLDWEAWRG